MSGYHIWLSGYDIIKSICGIILSGYGRLTSRHGNNIAGDCTI